MARGQSILLVAIILVLLIGAAGLNYYEQIVAPTDAELAAKAAAQQQASGAAATQPKRPTHHSPVTIPKTVPPTAGPNTVAPADLTLGNPASKTVIGLGYTVDAATEIDPSGLDQIAQTLIQWSKGHPNDEVKIVCLDLPKDQLTDPDDQNLPLGLSLNGTDIGGCDTNPGEGLLDNTLAATVLAALK